MKACKHLAYERNYPGCTLCEIKDMGVWYWERQAPYADAPTRVQFCSAGRGRINGIFACYNPGEMPCYEPDEGRKGARDEDLRELQH